jgi:hypothetical protein
VRETAEVRQGHEHGFAVAHQELLPALGYEIGPSQVHHQAKVVVAVGKHLSGAAVA